MRGFVLVISSVFVLGCGSGTVAVGTQGTAPVIETQPGNQTVPLGSGASFSVVATGTPILSYQWQSGGVNIPGATSSSYSIQSTAASDSGATFDVVVTNAEGNVVSTQAVLMLGARAPAAGDLRFQQVDASTTVNGYTGYTSINLLGGGGYSVSNAFGIPLSVGPSCDPNVTPSIFNCGWIIDTFLPLASTTTLSTSYGSYAYSDLQSTLSGLSNSSIVITGMDLEPVSAATAFSWDQQSTGQAFDGAFHTVATSSLAGAIASEGESGRVVTAISYNSGQVSYMSYGWQGNGTVVYDSIVQTATMDNAAETATTLAADGYILTAIGGNEYSGVLLVGTRVSGDSLARPISVIPGGQSPYPLATQGYAMVGVLYSASTGFVDWIGER
jgi:hypothetical protein